MPARVADHTSRFRARWEDEETTRFRLKKKSIEFEYNKKKEEKNCTLRYIAAAPTTATKRVEHTLVAASALDEGGGALDEGGGA